MIMLKYYFFDLYFYIFSFVSLSVSSSASLEKLGFASECDFEHREPLPSGFHVCGECINGYHEDFRGICVPDLKSVRCPEHLNCPKLHREPCDADTDGACGECIDGYIYLQGYCISDEVADKAIRTLTDILDKRVEIDAPSKKSEDSDGDIVESSTSKPHKQVLPLSADKRDQTKTDGVEMALAESDSSSVGFSKLLFFCIIAGATLICLVSLIIAGVCWYRLQKMRKSMQPAEYVGYGGGEKTPSDGVARSDSSGDRKLAHSAQMYHYQHHKQQMMALEKSLSDKLDESDAEDAEENEDGNYTVYECPGLAPTGEMEVSNPHFQAGKASSSTSPTSSPPSMPSPQSAMISSQEAEGSTSSQE